MVQGDGVALIATPGIITAASVDTADKHGALVPAIRGVDIMRGCLHSAGLDVDIVDFLVSPL